MVGLVVPESAQREPAQAAIEDLEVAQGFFIAERGPQLVYVGRDVLLGGPDIDEGFAHVRIRRAVGQLGIRVHLNRDVIAVGFPVEAIVVVMLAGDFEVEVVREALLKEDGIVLVVILHQIAVAHDVGVERDDLIGRADAVTDRANAGAAHGGPAAIGHRAPIRHALPGNIHVIAAGGFELPAGPGSGILGDRLDRFSRARPEIIPVVEFEGTRDLRALVIRFGTHIEQRILRGLKRERAKEGVPLVVGRLDVAAAVVAQDVETEAQFLRHNHRIGVERRPEAAEGINLEIQLLEIPAQVRLVARDIDGAAGVADAEQDRVGPAGEGHAVGVVGIDREIGREEVGGKRIGTVAAHDERTAGAEAVGVAVALVAAVGKRAREEVHDVVKARRAHVAQHLGSDDGHRRGDILDLGAQTRAGQRVFCGVAVVDFGGDDERIQLDRGLLRCRRHGRCD